MFAPGDKLEYGHYTVLRELGAGGMGVVYHCRDEFLQREIAIKMLLPELMADDDTVEVFRQEARLAAQLEHPNVVTIHNIGIENKEGKVHHYIAMEFLPGGSLKQRIERPDQASLEQCLEWMKQMTVGLNYAHKRGVVHQDIKPDNVFIAHDGNLKIGDFGLALIATGVAVERAVQGKGTPAYMSPELCRGDPQDLRSDIYSLGAVFFELLTTEKPYKASGMIEMAMKHATAPVPSAKKLNSEIPDVLDKAIQKMMAKAADDRYQSLAEVLTILEKLLLEMQVARLGVGTYTPAPPPEPAKGKAPEPAPKAEAKKEPAPAKKAAPPKPAAIADPLDDLLDSLLAEKEALASRIDSKPVESKPAESKPAPAKPANEPAKAAPAAESKPPVQPPTPAPQPAARAEGAPHNFTDDVTMDIDTVFQSMVRAESAAMAHAAQAERDAAEIGRTVQGPAAAGDGSPRKSHGSIPVANKKQRQPEIAWSFRTSGPIGWSSAPLISKDRKSIYIGSTDGFLYCLDLSNGTIQWRYDTGGAVIASPLLHSDKLFVASSNGSLHALSTKGEKLWSTTSASPLVATPLLCESDVLIASMDGALKYVNGSDGSVKWTYRTEGAIVSTPQLLEKLVVVTSKDKCLHAVSLDKGWRQWIFQTQGPIVCSPLVSTDSVYIGSTDGCMYAVEAENGKMIWQYDTEHPIVSMGTLEFTSVTVCSEDKWVHCIEKYKGLLVWKSRLQSAVIGNLVSSAGNLYVPNREGLLQCFNLKNGELNWQMDCEARLESSPLVAQKMIYLGKVSGELTAYNLPA